MPNTPENQSSLINSELNHINNMTPNSNYNLNNNYIISNLSNNIAVDNSNNRSLGNLSNSGNINSSSSFK